MMSWTGTRFGVTEAVCAGVVVGDMPFVLFVALSCIRGEARGAVSMENESSRGKRLDDVEVSATLRGFLCKVV